MLPDPDRPAHPTGPRRRVIMLVLGTVLASGACPATAIASPVDRTAGGAADRSDLDQAQAALVESIGETRLTAADGVAFDSFGTSVTVSGDTAVVGAPGVDYPGVLGAGAAYVFVRSGSTWVLQATLTSTVPAEAEAFGVSVALDGDTAVIGAPGFDPASGKSVGAAYVFVRSGSSWARQGTLGNPNGPDTDYFAYSVAVSGNTAVVGARGDDTPAAASAGAAHVFVRNGTSWTQQATLAGADGESADEFGYSVAVDGDTALVGARADRSPAGRYTGSASVFIRSGNGWTEQAKLTASDGAYDDYFGNSVALDGNSVMVGAPFDDHLGNDEGSAYLFVRAGTYWTQRAKLIAPDAATDDLFGSSVALDGPLAAATAPGDNNRRGRNAGAAYAFARSATGWSERWKLIAADGTAEDFLGLSVAVSGRTVMVGAPVAGGPAGESTGAAYAFSR